MLKKDQEIHNHISTLYPNAVEIVDRALVAIVDNFLSHPLFAILVTVVFIVLAATNIVGWIVSVALVIGWIVAFSWIARSNLMRKLTIVPRLCVLIMIGLILALSAKEFGYWALEKYQQNNTKPPSKSEMKETPAIKTDQPKQSREKKITEEPVSDKTTHKDVPKKEPAAKPNQLEDRPYFAICGSGFEIKTTPKLHTDMNLNNIGKHIAINLFNREILIDQGFQEEPSISDSSEGNEITPNAPHTCSASITPQPVMVPIYIVFAIRYQDKERVKSKSFSQIWCFKTIEEWVGGDKGTTPPKFLDVSIQERQNIIDHLRSELKDYLN